MAAAIQVHGLAKAYVRDAEQVVALDGIDLSAAPGEVLAIVGASGSGKSTLLNLLAGFDRPDRGTIHIDALEVTAQDGARLDQLRTRTLGFVFQQFNLIASLSAEQNVELALWTARLSGHERARRARVALERVGLAGLRHRRPRELSGGQQQRVAIARAIVGAPGVLLADEPTAALDAATADQVLEQIGALAASGEMTVILASHDPRCVARAHRTVTLVNGRVQP